MKLSKDEIERIQDIFDFGFFMDGVLKTCSDADGNTLSDEIILLLIDASKNILLFDDYVYESDPCESCGSHGSESAVLYGQKIYLRVW